MAKDLEMGYLLDFYGEVLTEKQREMLRQYYNDDLSLSEIGENFGITRQGARDAIKHGETTLKELEEKVGFAARYRRVQQKLEELEQLDGVETAVLLIEDNEGTITRYGVVYDNGMQLSQLYDGKHLPCYHYEADMTAVGISPRQEPENSKNVTWVYLPASKGQIERAMQRSGITEPKDMRLWIADSSFPEEVDVALDFRCDNIHELNELALAVEKFSIHDRKKLGAAVSMAKPENASQIRRLAENMDLFEFAPGAHTPAEYGKYMIQKSGHFEYDPNLDEFYDYERYGLQHMDYQSGVFTDRGYIAYVGTVDLEELMAEGPVDQCQREQEVQMGGMA